MGRLKTPAMREAQKLRAQRRAKGECEWYLARGAMPPLHLFCKAGQKKQHYTRDALAMDTARRMVGLFTALAHVAGAE